MDLGSCWLEERSRWNSGCDWTVCVGGGQAGGSSWTGLAARLLVSGGLLLSRVRLRSSFGLHCSFGGWTERVIPPSELFCSESCRTWRAGESLGSRLRQVSGEAGAAEEGGRSGGSRVSGEWVWGEGEAGAVSSSPSWSSDRLSYWEVLEGRRGLQGGRGSDRLMGNLLGVCGGQGSGSWGRYRGTEAAAVSSAGCRGGVGAWTSVSRGTGA